MTPTTADGSGPTTTWQTVVGSPRQAIATDKGRFYVWPPDPLEGLDVERFISVTNAMDKGIPKPAITRWLQYGCSTFAVDNLELVQQTVKADNGRKAAIDLIAQAPYRESEKALALGSLIHDICECMVLGSPLPAYDPKHEGFVDAFKAFVHDFEVEFEMTEATVYNRTYGYGGTLDFIATIPGYGRVLGDYKTTKPNFKTGHGIYPETALQLNAYAAAEFVGLPDGSEAPLPQVDELWGVNLRPDGYKVVPVQYDGSVFRTFLYVLQVAQFVNDGSALVGKPCGPRQLRSDRRPVAPPNVSALVD